MRGIVIFAVIALYCLLSFGCSVGTDSNSDHEVIRENGSIFIVDQTGKRWDVTHAEQQYGLKAENFQFGLGPNAIPPITNPKFAGPGDPQFPDENRNFLVIGVSLGNAVKSYPISIMSINEIAIEDFGNLPAAVAY